VAVRGWRPDWPVRHFLVAEITPSHHSFDPFRSRDGGNARFRWDNLAHRRFDDFLGTWSYRSMLSAMRVGVLGIVGGAPETSLGSN
jgi:hypothetical protein